ncbi:MAG: serine hydrolase domain-containing protein [Pseudobacter sp.]|uniref:serine hydrolase domain-containing protein n=1 Tax=Pseudobacter sp. TaxID=2045420 RepID=UPI003F7DA2AB
MKNIFAKAGMLLTLSLIFLHHTSVMAQDKLTEIDKIFNWTSEKAPGCVCTVSQHGKVILNRAYGSADLERKVPLSVNSVFDAGSLAKQFVAAATLLLVEEGKLSLTEDIHQYIPELPDYGFKITLDHLLTHTSGIRDWTGMMPITNGDPDALKLVMRQRGLNFAPGDEWDYSNSGYVLLKEIIARKTGNSFAAFANARLFEKLGMKSTSYKDDLRDIIPDRALAYEKKNNNWKMMILMDNDRGGGGALMSTASDLVIWNDAITDARLGKFVTAKIQEPATLNNGRVLGYGRGLFLDSYRGVKEIWHSGSAAGYKGWLGRYPEHGLSIAILCNSGDGTNRMQFAHRIVDLLVDAADLKDQTKNIPGEITDSAALAALDLKSRAGLYFNDRTGEPVRIQYDGIRLRIANGPALAAIGKNRFKSVGAIVQYMSQDEFELNFVSKDLIELKSMEGLVTTLHRARMYAPSADELRAMQGRYASDEIGTAFTVTAGDGMLIIQLEHTPEKKLPFKPVDTNAFQGGMMIIRMLRNDKGAVTGFEYGNPVLRWVKFRKTE